MASLRDQTARIVMPQGSVLSGTVTDPNGAPVADAVVVFGSDPYGQTGSQEVRTDADGVYHLPPLKPEPTTVTVIAEGWRPEMRAVEVRQGAPPEDFQLDDGHALQIRFIDAHRNPIPDVGVGIRTWRDKKSLYNHRHPEVLDTQIPAISDGQGIYQWLWAPEDDVDYVFQKKGYRPMGKSLAVHIIRLVKD